MHSVRTKVVHFNSSLSKSFKPTYLEIEKVKKDNVYDVIMKYKKYIGYNEFTTRFYIIDDNFLLIHLNSIKKYLTYILQQIYKETEV